MSATPQTVTGSPYLSVNNIEVIYDHVILVLKGVSLEVPEGRIVALLGANGAGKSTTLKAISNLLAAERGDVTKGTIEFKGKRVDKLTTNELVKMGVCQVMEGRHCFQHLTVEENLLTGAFTRKGSRAQIATALEKVYHYFPRLKTRRSSQAGYTSGGEQQMTAVGRALMAQPSMILLDEPSMGLAPQIVEEIFEIVQDLNTKEGVSFLLAEQNTMVALRYANYGYILENGRVVMDGEAKDLATNEDVKEFYLGLVIQRPQVLPRCKALPPPQTLARLILALEHFDALETRDPELRERAQVAALPQQIAYAKSVTGAFARILADVDPVAVISRAALAHLPVTRKSELLEIQKGDRPFGGFAAAGGKQGWLNTRRVFASPGPIYEPEGARPDYWRLARALFAAGFRAGDLIHNCFSYHFTPAGSMLETAAHALGCTVFPGGIGQTEQQVQAMAELRPDGYVGTPSFLRIILEKADEQGVALPSLRRALFSGEAFLPAFRDALAARGIDGYQVYATADVGTIAYETSARDRSGCRRRRHRRDRASRNR